MKKEFNINLDDAKYFAGHSLGEYSALSSAGYLNFSDTVKILKIGERLCKMLYLKVSEAC